MTKSTSIVPDDDVSLAVIATDDNFIRDAAFRIRLRLERTQADIIEIGRDLIAVKERLGHGEFGPWIKTEFGMSADMASRFMNVARNMADQIPHGAEFAPSVLYELAAPSTSQEVRDVVEAKVAAGEKITAPDVKRLKKLEKENENLKSALEKAEKGKPAEVRALQSNVVRLQANNAELASENATLTAQNIELAGEVQAAHASTVAFSEATSRAADTITALSPLHASVIGAVAAINRLSVAGHDEFWRVDDLSHESARREIDRAISRLQSLLAAGSRPVVEVIPPQRDVTKDDLGIPDFLDRRKMAEAS